MALYPTAQQCMYSCRNGRQATYESDHLGGAIASIKAAHFGAGLPKHCIVCCYLHENNGVFMQPPNEHVSFSRVTRFKPE